MKTKHLTTKLYHNSSPKVSNSKDKIKQGASEYEHSPSVSRKNCEYNNRPAKSVNFSGSASLSNDTAEVIQKSLNKLINEGVKEYKGIKKPGNLAYKVIDGSFFNKALRLVKNNEAKFENIITIFLAGMLKPICVLAMPGAEEEDKQMAATKNIVAAVTGFFLSNLILTPVSKGVKKVTKNLAKYIQDPVYRRLVDSNEFGDEVIVTLKSGKKLMPGDLADAFSTFYKKIPDLAITPTKAAITIAFMPHLLNLLFGKRKAERAAAKKAQMEAQQPKITINLEKDRQTYKQFLGGENQCK